MEFSSANNMFILRVLLHSNTGFDDFITDVLLNTF